LKTLNKKRTSSDNIVVDANEYYYQQAIERLANALTIIPVIGYGDEHTNQEALKHWMAIALQSPDHEMARIVLPHLVRRLGDKLGANTRKMPCSCIA